MYGSLPRPLTSRSGFQGCFSSFETNGELLDPIKDALVPSTLVEEGCEGELTFQGVLLKSTTVKKRQMKKSDKKKAPLE